MDRFLAACLLMLAVLCALCIADFTLEQHTSAPEDRAVRIALADPGVQATLASRHNDYQIESVILGNETDKSGFINASGRLAVVNMSMDFSYCFHERFIVFVDLDKSRVAGSEWYSWRGFPASQSITLSPGASYYHLLSGPINGGPGLGEDFGVQSFWGHISGLTPESAELYPVLVDEANLTRMKNGNSYEATVYNDTFTELPAAMNGSIPVSQGWSVNASIKLSPRYDTGNWSDFDFSQHYYIVFKNAGPDTVSMTIGM